MHFSLAPTVSLFASSRASLAKISGYITAARPMRATVSPITLPSDGAPAHNALPNPHMTLRWRRRSCDERVLRAFCLGIPVGRLGIRLWSADPRGRCTTGRGGDPSSGRAPEIHCRRPPAPKRFAFEARFALQQEGPPAGRSALHRLTPAPLCAVFSDLSHPFSSDCDTCKRWGKAG